MERVVITGMGAVTPIGNDAASYWEALAAGKNGIGPITYFDTENHRVKLAAQLKDFDPLLHLEKPLARKVDPFTCYALYASQEAVDDSGILGNVSGERLGVCFGSGIGGFQTLAKEHEALLSGGPRKVTPQFISRMISNIAAGNIAIRFGAHGSCISPTTACASGATAIGEAFRQIRHGYADAMLCGGSEAAITPLAVAGFTNAQALSDAESADEASLPFDARRRGFVIGEGAGCLVLESLSHARARGARIYAEVTGYGSTCDAHHVTAPNPDVRYSALAVRQAMAGLEEMAPGQIYVNAHGTGTKLNDKTETDILKDIFGADARKLRISSTKSMTGHTLGAAGAIEAVAAVQAMRHGLVPPTINLAEPDPECDLDYTPGQARPAELTAALSLSLGFGGHNACLAFRKWEE